MCKEAGVHASAGDGSNAAVAGELERSPILLDSGVLVWLGSALVGGGSRFAPLRVSRAGWWA